jgi:hypothetical protein
LSRECAYCFSNLLVRRHVIISCFLDIVLDIGEHVTLGEESLAERDRMNGCHIPVKQVDLLERKSLRLRNAEVREDDAAETRRTPDVEHLGAKVEVSWARVNQIGGY